jgi:WD40 repeat protein
VVDHLPRAIRTKAWRVASVCLIAGIFEIAFALGQSPQIKHWEVDVAATDADLSPDDHLLAVTLESPTAPQRARESIVESIQVWDYRQNSQIASTELAIYPNIKPTPNVVRFTADGALLVVSDPIKLHVLEASTLKSIRIIEPPLSQGSRIAAIETDPVGHIAMVGVANSGSGTLFSYDLDTGRLLFQSKLPHAVSSIAWSKDGAQFAVATPFPCTRFSDTIQVFNTNPWKQLRTLTAKDASSLTFSEERLYAVQTNLCKGSVFNRHLGLEAFELKTWNRERTLFLPHKDVHTSVSYAGGLLLANTGAIETKFDWLDAVTYARDVHVEFTIWESEARSVKWTLAPSALPLHGREVRLRLSRSGKMILLNAKNPQVFQLP